MKIIELTKLLPQEYTKNFVKIENNALLLTTKNQYTSAKKIVRYLPVTSEILYNLGLWFGDKYIRGNSVGLTNTEIVLLESFKKFLKKVGVEDTDIKLFPQEKPYRIYTNSGLLKRILLALEERIHCVISDFESLCHYLSGKIDADGTIMPYNLRWKTGFIKITYNSSEKILKKDIIPF